MEMKELNYKLSLSGKNITIKDREISESVALGVISLIMGGARIENENSEILRNPFPTTITRLTNSGEPPSPKMFMAVKKPSSETERIICLAYYLTNFRSTPAFKTKDLSKLNTEAAQPLFSNATAFARNADNAGYLAKAGGGSKQITTLGEAIVAALPNREDVKSAIIEYESVRKRNTRKVQKKPQRKRGK